MIRPHPAGLTALAISFVLLVGTLAAAQRPGPKRGFRPPGFHFRPGPHHGPGAFFGQRSFFRFPGHRFPGQRRDLADPGPRVGLFSAYQPRSMWSPGPGQASDRTSAFVSTWSQVSPGAPADSGFRPLQGSPLLREGMTPDEVVRRLGVPLQRRPEGSREVWKYSSFWLLFSEGRLSGIR